MQFFIKCCTYVSQELFKWNSCCCIIIMKLVETSSEGTINVYEDKNL